MKKRPDDPAVWQARLNWAMLVVDPEAAFDTLGRIPVDRLAADEIRSLLVWFLAHRNDVKAEMETLQLQLRQDLDKPSALARLAVLAYEAGDFQRLRASFVNATSSSRACARRIADCSSPSLTGSSFPELEERAAPAEKLGRWFEAQGWGWMLAVEQCPLNSSVARRGMAKSASRVAEQITLLGNSGRRPRGSGVDTAPAGSTAGRTSGPRHVVPGRCREAPGFPSFTRAARRRFASFPRP